MRHRLPELGPPVRVLDEVDLVDDVDETLRLGDSPEHLSGAQANLPAACTDVTEEQQLGLPHVEVRAPADRNGRSGETGPA